MQDEAHATIARAIIVAVRQMRALHLARRRAARTIQLAAQRRQSQTDGYSYSEVGRFFRVATTAAAVTSEMVARVVASELSSDGQETALEPIPMVVMEA